MIRDEVENQAAGAGTAEEVERRLFTRIAWRLMPILTVGYLLNYMDRNNVGFAALTMNKEVGLTATQFGTGAGILFLGYCFFEVPSNVALYRFGARNWISRIMITWGLISAATILVAGPKSWYLMRFLLGAAEAGFFPGVAFYIGTWFPAQYRARMLAWFLLAPPLSSVVSGPVSSLLMQMNGVAGFSGWKWLFIGEGLPVVLLGIIMIWIVADRPENAKWLTEEERQLVRDRLASERREKEVRHFGAALKDVRVIILALVEFCFLVGSYGVGIWLPQIIQEGHMSSRSVGLVFSGCYLVASIGMIIWSAQVDRSGHRIKNLALSCLIASVGFLFALMSGNFWISLAWVTVALTGITAARAIFWTIPPRFLTGLAAAGGLAFINSVGTIGGFIGPSLMGWLKDRTGSFTAGLMAMTGFLLVATLLAWSLKLTVEQE